MKILNAIAAVLTMVVLFFAILIPPEIGRGGTPSEHSWQAIESLEAEVTQALGRGYYAHCASETTRGASARDAHHQFAGALVW